MLDAMSKILGFSMEEKEVLGLVKKNSLEDDKQGNKGIGDKLINFLLDDEDE